MLTDKACNKLVDIHKSVGADWQPIFERARELASHKAGRIENLWRDVEVRGVRTAFFETWSAFWFISDSLSLESKVELSARMLVSAAAIAQLDHIVDHQGHSKDESYCAYLADCVTLWEEYAEGIFVNCERWSRYVVKWTEPRHGINDVSNADELLLAKNPFYPAAIRTYFSWHDHVSFATDFAVALGLLDDAADIREDFICGNFNAALAVEQSFLWRGDLKDLQSEVFRQNLISKAIDRAVNLIQDMQRAARAAEMALFVCTLEQLLESLEGYPELCTARLIMA